MANKILQIKLDARVAKRFDAFLEGRGVDATTFLSLYIRTFVKEASLLGLKDAMDFGKYSGETVEDIVRVDPSYITWVVQNGKKPKFLPEVLQLVEDLEEMIAKQKAKR